MKRKDSPKAATKKEKKNLHSFFVPSIGRAVKAASLEESVKIAEKLVSDTQHDISSQS